MTKVTLSRGESSLLSADGAGISIVLRNARERAMGTRLAIYLVYRASANNLTKAENTITIILIFRLPSGWCFI